ncbi:MAG: histidinol-phosphate transaminase [Flavobacteriales bacterium]|nr:histidinol-phosphate transaminase [Flavobacteriales bacterium]
MIDLNSIIRPNIRQLKPYSSARDEFSGTEGIFLDANENPFGTLNRYPDPYQQELKAQIADLKGLNTDSIFIGNGSDEVIDLVFRICCEPGKDKALTFTPTYGMYEVAANINNAELIHIPLDDQFQIDLKTVQPYLSDPKLKLILICSPNNPTGNLMEREKIEYILANFEGLVLVDEAYVDFADEESLIGLLSKYNNLIVSQTFSKAWGLAAARVGTAYASQEMIGWFNKVKPPYNVSTPNQQAVLNALKNYKEYSKQVEMIRQEKEQLINALGKIASVKRIYPSDANFILLEVDDANALYAVLSEQKIIVRNRNTVIPNGIRISIGTPEENNLLINTLTQIA